MISVHDVSWMSVDNGVYTNLAKYGCCTNFLKSGDTKTDAVQAMVACFQPAIASPRFRVYFSRHRQWAADAEVVFSDL